MSGKEAAPALSVDIDDGAIPMEEDRSWLYAASRSSAAAGAGTRVLAQSLPSAPESCLPARQNAGTAVESCGSGLHELECLWNAAAVSKPESESEPGSERNFKKIRIN